MTFHFRNLHQSDRAAAIFEAGAAERAALAEAYTRHIAAPGQRADVHRRFMAGLEACDRSFAASDAHHNRTPSRGRDAPSPSLATNALADRVPPVCHPISQES